MKENIELKTRLAKQSAELKLMEMKYEEKADYRTTIDRILLGKVHNQTRSHKYCLLFVTTLFGFVFA